ncbi:MAG: regulator SirB [Gallionellaceae bacterium]|nr:MAG: regulator SirB [Gallionellaceae bacterium]
MEYLAVKHLHMTCVAVSYALFFVRGIWMLRASPLLQQRWVKVAPHIVDTLLLVSAITLAYLLGISPLAEPWLGAKIIALLIYIVLGSVALKRGKTLRIRLAAWLVAQGVFFYIVAVAITRDVRPWLN